MCDLRLPFCAVLWGQCGQAKGFSFVWTRTCIRTLKASLKRFRQTKQVRRSTLWLIASTNVAEEAVIDPEQLSSWTAFEKLVGEWATSQPELWVVCWLCMSWLWNVSSTTAWGSRLRGRPRLFGPNTSVAVAAVEGTIEVVERGKSSLTPLNNVPSYEAISACSLESHALRPLLTGISVWAVSIWSTGTDPARGCTSTWRAT